MSAVNPKAYPLANAEVRAPVQSQACRAPGVGPSADAGRGSAVVQHHPGHRPAGCQLPTAEEGRKRGCALLIYKCFAMLQLLCLD